MRVNDADGDEYNAPRQALRSMSITDLALHGVKSVPEHELRRLLQRMAVTDARAVIRAVEQMHSFDMVKRQLR